MDFNNKKRLGEANSDSKNPEENFLAGMLSQITERLKQNYNYSDDEISKLEIGTGEIYEYTLDEKGNVINKNILAVNADKTKI